MISFFWRIRLYLIISLTITFVSACVYLALRLEMPERIKPGDINIAFVATDIGLTSANIQLAIIAWYVNSVSVAPIVAEEYYLKLSYMFKYWDRMNLRIIPENEDILQDMD